MQYWTYTWNQNWEKLRHMAQNDAFDPTTPELSPSSRAIHTEAPADLGGAPLGIPLYQSQVYRFAKADQLADALAGPGAPFVYGRHGNPTVAAFEQAMADLEGGAAAWAAGSGMGAITSTVLGLLGAGDHVVAQNAIYGGTRTVLSDLAARWGLEVSYVDPTPDAVRAALRPNTRLVHLETIANPTGAVHDLKGIAAVAREAGAYTVVDNTFATPLLCRPIEHGADIVVHSATKYIGGHADVLGGVAVFADRGVLDTVWPRVAEYGSALDPFAAWLLARGLQTLGVRMRQHSANTLELATRLDRHPGVRRVHYPGLPDHPSHARATELLDGGYGGVLAFELDGGREAGRTFIEAVRLVSLSASLGDVKSLAMHPATVSHRHLTSEELAAAGIDEGLIRFSVGIEDVEDIWRDVDQALAHATGA
ncbi:trans-sulfuration enzyme family protein [Spiractinospora alimapuensis]|uniref:trans-sulfuration enzyme family protein n=1 Tax=Spiractinospora alimapuensis TaxID=2820884 RepID=UPI001F364DE1|nr:aminotransferase class I/II-fold pyridoxal phosphate-dependent enzyme [Spiractinospora alimapuensis]